MFTPQQIEEISFSRATFGGYDMQSVDEFLEPLTEDYITLYKENALLKSKMRVLVSKLEEYRQNEASMKDAMVNAQKTCDKMVKDAQSKCTKMLQEANAAAADNARNAATLIEEERARVEDARRSAAEKIDSLQSQLRSCLDTLEKIKKENRPAQTPKKAEMFDVVATDAKTQAAANEISLSIENLVGSTGDHNPKHEGKPPIIDTTGNKFANLQFGRNYDPDAK